MSSSFEHHPQTRVEKDVAMVRAALHGLRRYALPLVFLFVGLLLWLTWYIPAWFPGSHAAAFRVLNEHLLFVVVLSLSLVALLFWLLLWKVPQWQVAYVFSTKDRLDLETKSRQTMAQILGGAVLLGGLFFTAQTLQTTQEGQITERFTKAIDQLGKSGEETLAVRLGGIYALERIARDSAKDHEPIMEVLTAFVREQTHVQKTTPAKPSPASGKTSGQEKAKVPADIQAILTVLGRRTRTYGKGESQPLDLSRAQLQGANLAGAQLQGANLAGAQLQKANLWEAQLQGADLAGAQLQKANLVEAQLQRAFLQQAQLQEAFLQWAQLQKALLWEAQLQRAFLAGAQLQGANLVRANLAGAQLQGADLREVKNLTQDQINLACVDKHTKLPEEPKLTPPAPCPVNVKP
jgi:hypothetical protein